MEGVFQLLELHHIVMLVLGVLLGITVGAMPGLTPTMGVALCIPFTFSLPAADGLILLGGIFCGSIFGGAIPSILFNVPGAPASVATTFDGYPMAQQGKAIKALELATISSAIGGLFGMILLLFFAPILTTFSLQFGPAQTFWIALFGITVIAAISEGSITKNLLGGGLGILLAFIGISTFTGTARFTFGSDALIGGLHIVAVLIGLFAFPQALRLIESLPKQDKKTEKLDTSSRSSIRASFSDVLKKPKPVIFGSGIGAFVGMIPGAGGNIASILAYNEVKRFSKQKQGFGKGRKEGIIASESANNALVGGSLIPLLTLGIPGSPTAAIFLGGLLIHGIWPGRNLFVENATVAYTFLYSMVVAQLILLVFGLLLIRPITKLVDIPSYFMAPVILSFCIIGAYTTQNSLFDIYTVVVIGLFMFLLQKYQFSPAPIALGFILGPIAEEGLLQGMQVGAASGNALVYFTSGVWNISLICLVLITIVLAIKPQFNTGDKKTEVLPLRDLIHLNIFSFSSIRWLGLFLLTAYSIYTVGSLPFEQRLFPQVTLIVLLVLTASAYVQSLLNPSGRALNKLTYESSTFMFIVFTCIVCFVTNVIGFYTQVILLMMTIPFFAYAKKQKKSTIMRIMLISTTFTTIMYLVFTAVIRVPLPAFPFFIIDLLP